MKTQEKKLCHIITKVYLLRWRIEEYFRFKKQQFELEDLRQSIRNRNLFSVLAVGYISLTTAVHEPFRYQQFPAAKSPLTADPPV